jgi:hypothetical protein
MIFVITIDVGTAKAALVVCVLAKLIARSKQSPTASGFNMFFSTTLPSGNGTKA